MLQTHKGMQMKGGETYLHLISSLFDAVQAAEFSAPANATFGQPACRD